MTKNYRGAKTDKIWRNALLLALHDENYKHDGEKTKALRLVARAVVRKAMDGDMAAAKEIGDRLDGKPAQSIEAKQHSRIEVVIKDATALASPLEGRTIDITPVGDDQ